MTRLQRSRRFSNRFCGRRLNGLGKNRHEGRSSYGPHLTPSFLAGCHFFSHSLHGFILTRSLDFLAESPRPSTLSRTLAAVIRRRNCCSPGSSDHSLLRSIAARLNGASSQTVTIEACGGRWVDVARKSMCITLYISMDMYHTVIMSRSAPLCPGDNCLFFIFFFSICEFAGTCGRREGRLPAVRLCDRRSSLRPEVLIRLQRARRGRPQAWKEIVKP
jgi:hypothetical protein